MIQHHFSRFSNFRHKNRFPAWQVEVSLSKKQTSKKNTLPKFQTARPYSKWWDRKTIPSGIGAVELRGGVLMKMRGALGEGATLFSSVLLFVKENVIWRGIVSDAFLQVALSLEDKISNCILYIYLHAKAGLTHIHLPNQLVGRILHQR